MSAERSSRLFRFAGWALTAASFVFIAIVAGRRWTEITAIQLGPEQWFAILGLALAYGAALFLLAAAWHFLLLLVGAAPAGPARSMHAHATSQLAKYIPGNVFHYVGRHMMLRGDGASDRRLALASLLEAGLMLASAGMVVILAIAVEPPDGLENLFGWLGDFRLPVLAFVAVVGAGLALIVASRLGGGRSVWAACALGGYILFFAIMGAIIVAIVTVFAAASPIAAAGGGVAAWMVGFATPGAPGGLGTREAAMLLFVGDQLGPATLLVIAALFRIVTFGGDLVCFAVSQVLLCKR